MRQLAVTALLFLCVPAMAAFEQFEFESPDQRVRYSELTKKLRCLVCQNQSLSDSDATLAGDLRVIVHEMIISGSSDDEIIGFMIERYGDFVLYEPPVRGTTYALWASPFLLLLVGALVVWRLVRNNVNQQ